MPNFLEAARWYVSFIWHIPISRGFIFPRRTVPSALNCVGIPLGFPVLSQAQIRLNSFLSVTFSIFSVLAVVAVTTFDPWLEAR